MLDSTTSPHQLAVLLGTSHSKLCHLIYGVGVNSLYSDFVIEKKAGGKRYISSPESRLKYLQFRLKLLLEDLYKPHVAATAFIRNRGIVYNAKKHVKKALVFNIDLSDFYGQIHFGRVRGVLRSKPYALREDTAQIIAHMCCYKSVVPQGAPTSPVISNMICKRLDRQLSALAKQNRAYYTRYADDITFSFRSTKNNEICELLEGGWKPTKALVDVVEKNSFSINMRKVRGEVFSSRQVVTGLKVNKKPNVDRRYIRTTRAMIHSLRLDVDAANAVFREKNPEKEDARLESLVAGRVNFIGMVKGRESSVYQSLARGFNDLPVDVEVPLHTKEAKSEVDELLSFIGFSGQAKLERCIWIVSFDDIEELDVSQQLVQGTAFMLKEQVLITCSHTFSKAGDIDFCYVSTITEPGKKYKAKLVDRCVNSDVAKLKIVDEEVPNFDGLKVYNKKDLRVGYKLALAGFPQLQPGHNTVSVNPCFVTGSFVKSTFEHFEVSVEVAAGLSGGPVLNAYLQVVGMVVMGKTVSHNPANGEYAIEGANAFISAKYFS